MRYEISQAPESCYFGFHFRSQVGTEVGLISTVLQSDFESAALSLDFKLFAIVGIETWKQSRFPTVRNIAKRTDSSSSGADARYQYRELDGD